MCADVGSLCWSAERDGSPPPHFLSFIFFFFLKCVRDTNDWRANCEKDLSSEKCVTACKTDHVILTPSVNPLADH